MTLSSYAVENGNYADAGKYPRSLDELVVKRYPHTISGRPFHAIAEQLGRRAARRPEKGRHLRRAQRRQVR